MGRDTCLKERSWAWCPTPRIHGVAGGPRRSRYSAPAPEPWREQAPHGKPEGPVPKRRGQGERGAWDPVSSSRHARLCRVEMTRRASPHSGESARGTARHACHGRCSFQGGLFCDCTVDDKFALSSVKCPRPREEGGTVSQPERKAGQGPAPVPASLVGRPSLGAAIHTHPREPPDTQKHCVSHTPRPSRGRERASRTQSGDRAPGCGHVGVGPDLRTRRWPSRPTSLRVPQVSLPVLHCNRRTLQKTR